MVRSLNDIWNHLTYLLNRFSVESIRLGYGEYREQESLAGKVIECREKATYSHSMVAALLVPPLELR